MHIWTRFGDVYWSPEHGFHNPEIDIDAEIAASRLTNKSPIHLVRLLIALREAAADHPDVSPSRLVPKRYRRKEPAKHSLSERFVRDPVVLAVEAFGWITLFRSQVAENPHTPSQTLRRLMLDRDPETREFARHALEQRGLGTPAELEL